MFRPPNESSPADRARSRIPFSPWEGVLVLLALAVGFHFLALRIQGGGLPDGDEGSWIAVATELALGRGFMTRWLEAPFLLPYAIPRPDDFRYPVMTSLLALDFKIWGFSVETARWTVAWVFLAFASSTYLVCRFAFGRWAAMAGLWLMVTSLLQLEWNAAVYTEGMFGLVVAGLAAWCLRGRATMASDRPLGFRSFSWWAVLGGGVGILYLVRVNGILFLPGIALLFWSNRKSPLSWKHLAAALAAFALVISPWLIRAWMNFGNPFHFAGSGGLLRDPGQALTQSHTQNMFEYFSRHDLLFPLQRIGVGTLRFFQGLHDFEHGLEAAPLILALAAAILRRPFFNPFLAAGFILTLAASAYASYNSWAGVRYMSGLLPFAYAYGLSLLPSLFASKAASDALGRVGVSTRIPGGMLSSIAGALGIALLLAPVIHPHRFHERRLSREIAAAGPYAYRQGLAEHLAILETHLPREGRYYAASLCNANFLSPDRGCIGLQELYDPTWFARSTAAFHPRLIVLTHGETRDQKMLAALARMRSEGYAHDTLGTGALAVYLALRPVPDPPGNDP